MEIENAKLNAKRSNPSISFDLKKFKVIKYPGKTSINILQNISLKNEYISFSWGNNKRSHTIHPSSHENIIWNLSILFIMFYFKK